MKSLRVLLTLLLVALWPLATSHCDLEQLPGFEFLACAVETEDAAHAETDCETDTCASVESGLYKTEDTHQVVPTPPLIPSQLLTAVLLVAPDTLPTISAVLDAPPPGLPKSWQFVFRTALPPRAPSLVS